MRRELAQFAGRRAIDVEVKTGRLAMPKTKPKTKVEGRDAGTGKFITVSEAKRRPKTTVVEHVPIGKKPPKK